MLEKVLILFICFTGVFFFYTDLQAQQTDNSSNLINIYHLEPGETVTLDGKLNELFWQKIKPATNFIQRDPIEGGNPSENSEVYVAMNREYLYIGAKMFDSEPDKIIAFQKRRDQSLNTDDRFMFILDTFNTGRNAFFFQTNPAGLRGDGLINIGQGSNLNMSWDGIWDVRTAITDEGWFLEIEIPFRTLNFDPDIDTWGINFQRSVRRKNEEIIWSGFRRNQSILRPQDAGIITGLSDLNQGLGIEVVPYGVTKGTREWTGTERVDNATVDGGFDISYNITPNLRSSATVNTDFAEAEVDQRRVNLTRFPLFFPEQRDFFLEGSDIFSFAPASGVTPFFSRRIGLVEGQQIPINFGGKLLGRPGDYNVGLIQIQTGSKEDTNREDFTVARISRNLFEESQVGIIYTRRATHNSDLHDRHTAGIDFELSTSRFRGDKNLQFQAFFLWHNPNRPDEDSDFFDRSSRGIRISYPNYPISASMSYRELDKDFNPDVGFTPRNSFRRLQPSISYERNLEKNSLIREIEFSVRHEYLADMEFRPQSISTRFTPVDILFESTERFDASVTRGFERLNFPFDIRRDRSIIIPAGDYNFWIVDAEFSTASFRKFSGEIEFSHGGFWTGTRTQYELSADFRPWPGINLDANWTLTQVKLPEGDFDTDLFRFEANVDPTPSISFTSNVQFDTLSDRLGLFNRFRWILTPGTDLFLVHTANWLSEEDRLRPLSTGGTIKLSYNHRF